METIGTGKVKESLQTKIDALEKKSESRRKQVEYWKAKSNSWEEKFFFVQDQIGVDNQAMAKQLMTVETKLKWAHQAHKVMKQSNTELLEANNELIKNNQKLNNESEDYRIEISVLETDLDKVKDALEDLQAIQSGTKIMAWVGWVLFFASLLGFIFFKGI